MRDRLLRGGASQAIRIPLLPNRRRNDLGRLMVVFDWSRSAASDRSCSRWTRRNCPARDKSGAEACGHRRPRGRGSMRREGPDEARRSIGSRVAATTRSDPGAAPTGGCADARGSSAASYQPPPFTSVRGSIRARRSNTSDINDWRVSNVLSRAIRTMTDKGNAWRFC